MLYKKIFELTQEDMEHIMLREMEFFKVMDEVSVIINDVKKEGDDAVKKFTKEFDGADVPMQQKLWIRWILVSLHSLYSNGDNDQAIQMSALLPIDEAVLENL